MGFAAGLDIRILIKLVQENLSRKYTKYQRTKILLFIFLLLLVVVRVSAIYGRVFGLLVVCK